MGEEAPSISKAPPALRRLLLCFADCSYWVIGLWFSPALRSRLYGSCLKRYYGFRAPSYDGRAFFSGYNRGLESALEALSRHGHSPLVGLDAACGTGLSTLTLATAFPCAKVVGLDLAPAMLEVAAARAAEGKLHNAEFIQGNLGKLPFGPSSFDLVVLQNAPVALSELMRVTRQTGTVVVAFSLGGGIPRWLMALFIRKMRRVARLSSFGGEAGSFWAVLRPKS